MDKLKRRPASILLLTSALILGVAAPETHADESRLYAQAQDAGPPPGDADDPSDPSATVLRVSRLENQIRMLTGQIEQLQFQNKRLEDNLRKMQQDVEFRFQDLEHGAGGAAPRLVPPPQKRGDADLGAPGVDASVPPPSLPGSPPPAKVARSSGDAFDPSTDPTAPGAPKMLGTTAPSQPLARTALSRQASAGDEPRAPLDLMQRPGAPAQEADADIPAVIPAPPAAAARDLPNPNAVASLVPGGTREEYEADLGLYKQGQFDGAASGFQAFAEKYPKDRLVPDAVYLAGESFSRLGRHREAAEQFLKLSTDYGKSPRAPDALLRLGMSLNALGAKEQACATYMEVNRRYPAAAPDVRAGVDRELKRARCPGNG